MKRVIHLTNLPNLKEATEIKFIIPANAGSSLNVEFVFPQDLIAEVTYSPIQGQIVSKQEAASILATPSPTIKSSPSPRTPSIVPSKRENPLSIAKARSQSPVVIPTPQSRMTMNSPKEDLQQLTGEELSNVFLESQSSTMPAYIPPYRCTPAYDVDGNVTCELQGRSTMK